MFFLILIFIFNNFVIANLSLFDKDWEKELINDINEFELIENCLNLQKADSEWDAEIKALIENDPDVSKS